MQMLANTVRMEFNDQVREYAIGNNDSLRNNLAIGIINPDDFKQLNLSQNSNLKLSSKYGNVVIKVKQEIDIPKGTIILPVSIWANQITGTENNELIYKNILVNVEPTMEPVLDFEKLLKIIKEN